MPRYFATCARGLESILADELRTDPQSSGLLLVHPGMSADLVEAEIDRYGFLGFKPYRFYARSGDAVNCRITEFMPEHQIAVAHRRGLLIMMHVSKRDAIADPENVADMLRLCDTYPNAKWILAHCARSYSAWAIDQAAKHVASGGRIIGLEISTGEIRWQFEVPRQPHGEARILAPPAVYRQGDRFLLYVST